MFTLKVAQFYQRKNNYQEEMFNAFIEQSKVYYDNTIKKLEKGALDFPFKVSTTGTFRTS